MISTSKIKQLIENEEEGPTLDYKQDLALETDGDKAQFVKDVISLANSGGIAHIIIGVEDGTRKLIGLKAKHGAEQLNEILKDKTDPPISIEYAERNIMGHLVGVVEIVGENPPYIVATHDRYGGSLSSGETKKFWIERGTIFVRSYNMNDGASRASLEKMYKKKYTTLEADLQLIPEVSVKPEGNSKIVDIDFSFKNTGEVMATDIFVWMQFHNIEELVHCEGGWRDISNANQNVPTVEQTYGVPVIRPITYRCDKLIVKVAKNVKQIEARVIMGAINMRTIDGPYIISLEK